mmetsp:Transcript_9677/g.22371  ORF Transcript_9677/g.22371 Transcript_9677/m.22371 type:complete len:345 (+) Transcript_9677:1906-2940(+)
MPIPVSSRSRMASRKLSTRTLTRHAVAEHALRPSKTGASCSAGTSRSLCWCNGERVRRNCTAFCMKPPQGSSRSSLVHATGGESIGDSSGYTRSWSVSRSPVSTCARRSWARTWPTRCHGPSRTPPSSRTGVLASTCVKAFSSGGAPAPSARSASCRRRDASTAAETRGHAADMLAVERCAWCRSASGLASAPAAGADSTGTHPWLELDASSTAEPAAQLLPPLAPRPSAGWKRACLSSLEMRYAPSWPRAVDPHSGASSSPPSSLRRRTIACVCRMSRLAYRLIRLRMVACEKASSGGPSLCPSLSASPSPLASPAASAREAARCTRSRASRLARATIASRQK